jgi:hypothetical protein
LNELIIAHINLVSKTAVTKANENKYGNTSDELMDIVKKDTEINGEYSSILIENNNEIMKILKDNWSLIDLQDIKTFQDFLINVTRFKTEISELRFTKLSLPVSNELPEIMKNYPQYISTVKKAFEIKKRELKDLQAK